MRAVGIKTFAARRGRSGAAGAVEQSDMTKATPIVVWLVIAGLAIIAQGCREDEQNRLLIYDKGTYQGQHDEGLTEQQVDTLRQRSAGQKF